MVNAIIIQNNYEVELHVACCLLQDGVTGEIMALAQGFMDIAELMSKVKGVCKVSIKITLNFILWALLFLSCSPTGAYDSSLKKCTHFVNVLNHVPYSDLGCSNCQGEGKRKLHSFVRNTAEEGLISLVCNTAEQSLACSVTLLSNDWLGP